MEIKDSMIATLPVKPQEKTNIGMMLAPTIMDYLGTVLQIDKNFGINVLHSYDDKESLMDGYIEYLKKSGINYNSVFVDSSYADQLLEIIERMYMNDQLKIKNKEILRCDCGRVDMIYSLHNNGKLYTENNGQIICNYCDSECRKYKEKVLVFEIKKDNENISITPTYLKKEISRFQSTYDGKDIIVSKFRDTGYALETSAGVFNIDIDFLWMNYFKLFDKTNQIYVASNHQLFVMYLMNQLARTTSEKKLTFIANPYVNCNLETAKRQYEKRELEAYKKLLLLYNLKWKNKDCNWSDSNYQFLSNISDTKIKNLYNSMIISAREMYREDLPIDEILNQILRQTTNMQDNINIMKKLYKSGKLD